MGNRLSKIYTRTGDDGTTGLGDGTRVAKDSARVAAYGTVDEANCAIGLVLASQAPSAPIPDGIRDLLTGIGIDKATIVGHDWGGMVAWQFAMNVPAMTERLIVLNLPHPRGLLRELKSNPEQIANSEYARTFQRGSPGDATVFFGRPMTAETLSGWVTDPAARTPARCSPDPERARSFPCR